jgi:hypothetical protein
VQFPAKRPEINGKNMIQMSLKSPKNRASGFAILEMSFCISQYFQGAGTAISTQAPQSFAVILSTCPGSKRSVASQPQKIGWAECVDGLFEDEIAG